MKNLYLFMFRVSLIMMLICLTAGRSGCEGITFPFRHEGINKTLFLTVHQSAISEIICNGDNRNNLLEKQDPEEPLTKSEKKQLRKEKKLLKRTQRAEQREQLRIQMIEERNVDNPNHADYIILGKNLPRGQNIFTAINGRVPGLTIGNNGYVTAKGPISFYGGGAALFLLDEIEVGSETIKAIPVNDVERIEIFTGPSAAFYGTRAGTAVISVYTIKSIE